MPIVYYGFDILALGGRDVMSEPLTVRRELLRVSVLPALSEPIRESPILDASLNDLVAAVRAQGLEGVVAKRLDSRYEPGCRSGAWQKMRINRSENFGDRRVRAGSQELRHGNLRVLGGRPLALCRNRIDTFAFVVFH
ncbi:MAG: hypothetical protein ABSH56_32705 [Bryobacteraceae bacterium]